MSEECSSQSEKTVVSGVGEQRVVRPDLCPGYRRGVILSTDQVVLQRFVRQDCKDVKPGHYTLFERPSENSENPRRKGTEEIEPSGLPGGHIGLKDLSGRSKGRVCPRMGQENRGGNS